MTVEKPKPKQLLRPITTGTNSSMNQSQFLAITCNAPEAREISRVYGAIGFGFVSHWLKNWRESFKPITKRSNRNHVITFDSHLKTALIVLSLDHCSFDQLKTSKHSLAARGTDLPFSHKSVVSIAVITVTSGLDTQARLMGHFPLY